MVGRRVRYGVVGIAAAAFSILGCTLASVRFPEIPGIGGQAQAVDLIAYVGSDGNVYTVDPEDGKVVALTDDAQRIPDANGALHYYSDPAWAPGKTGLAFLEAAADIESGSRFSVWVRGEEDSASRVVFSSPNRVPIYLYWSPDGKQLSFLTSDTRGGPLALHIVPIDGGAEKVIDTGQPYYWSWSPTSLDMVVHVGGSSVDQPGVARLSLLSLAPEVTETAWDLAPLSFQAPEYSPDGGSILLSAVSESQGSGLLLVGPDGKVQSVLSDDKAPIAFAWNPPGEVIASMTFDPASPSGLGRLSFLHLTDSGEVKRVDTDAERVVAFFWSPDGEELAYFVPVAPGSNGGGSNVALQGPQVNLRLRIADPRDGTSRDVTTFRPTSDFLRILPFFDQYLRSTTIWSPDSRQLVLSGYDAAGQETIFVVSSDGSGDPRPLVSGILAFWSW